jgi:hypothetical protein
MKKKPEALKNGVFAVTPHGKLIHIGDTKNWKKEASGSITQNGYIVYSAPDDEWAKPINSIAEPDMGDLFNHITQSIKIKKTR